MTFRTLEQKRALYAWNVVSTLKNTFDSGKLLTLFRKLPSMIMQNGLITTIAFLKSKSISEKKLKEEGAVLYGLENYMLYRLNHSGEIPTSFEGLQRKDTEKLDGTHSTYLKKLLNMEFSVYRLESSEAIYIAQWLKRIAEGEIEDEGQGSD